MSDRTVRLLLWLTTASLIAFGILVMIAAMTVPLLGPVSPQVAGRSLVGLSVSSQPSTTDWMSMSVRDFEGVWGKILQRPVQELEPPEVVPEPDPVAQVSTPKPQFSAKLIGTISDSDPTMARAWIEVKGKARLVRNRETLADLPGEPVVVAIQPESILLMMGDEELRVELADDNALFDRTLGPAESNSP